MKVSILGWGSMGRKRAAALGADDELVGVYDIRPPDHPKACASREAIDRAEAVVIATPHIFLAGLAFRCLQLGKHVLVEKPGGVRSHALAEAMALAASKKLVLHVGYNHRFHPGTLAMKETLDAWRAAGEEPFLMRGFYGHGGRAGYDQEWRCDPAKSGGGELIDQGSHLIDLCLWMMRPSFGELSQQSLLTRAYWSDDVEDNAALLIKLGKDCMANLQVSWTSWRNRFELEATTASHCVGVRGIGGSYGTETYYEQDMVLGAPPVERTGAYADRDVSFEREWQQFRHCVEVGRAGNAQDACDVLRIIERAYER